MSPVQRIIRISDGHLWYDYHISEVHNHVRVRTPDGDVKTPIQDVKLGDIVAYIGKIRAIEIYDRVSHEVAE